MHRNTPLILALLAFIFMSLPAAAQTVPTDSLGGKTVHVYLPAPGWDTLMIQNLNIQMTKDAPNWYSYTFTKGGLYDYQDGFYFTDFAHRIFLSKAGLGNTEAPRFLLADFAGTKEIWIIVDPSGPVTAPPTILLAPPKIINVLNPWPTTGPALITASGRKSMVTTEHCGWFMAFLLKPTDEQFYLSEISDADSYGKGGFGSKVNYDLTADFASKGSTLWLSTDINAWTAAYPNKDGDCQYLMAATVRDFSKDHPDFEFGNLSGDFLTKGMVQTAIGPGRKPVSTGIALKAPITYGTFDTWWNTDSTNATPTMRSYETCVDIPMSKTGDGLWEYDSFRDSPSDHSFFPIPTAQDHFPAEEVASCYEKPPPDTTSWVQNGPKRDGNFCMESHATFIYQKGQHFAFRGDDDVWVFIHDQLVVDLGGVHTPKSDSVDLDKLNLTVGSSYNWDLFYCDRQPCGSSLRIKTSIYFKQQRALYGIQKPGPTPGSINLEIWKRTGGTGSCASIGTTSDSTKASSLTYQLLDANGTLVQALKDGPFYGGITIATPNITVDTATITGLPSGNYRIVAFEPANEKLRVEVPFKVPSRNLVEFEPPYTVPAAPVGALIKVIAANREKTKLVLSSEKYIPTWPAGLEVYTDSLRSSKLTSGATLSTDASGYDTLWVTGTATAKTDQTYIMSITLSTKTVTLTFTVPKNRVEFESPYTGTAQVGTLIKVVAANREKGVLVASSEKYTPSWPAGLEVYTDSLRSSKLTLGTTLSTDASGYDTLWVTGTATATTDQTYIMSIPLSTITVTLTFTVPKNRVEFETPFTTDTLVGSVVTLHASNRENGAVVAGAQTYKLNIPAGLQVYSKADKTGPITAATQLTTDTSGHAVFYATADSTDLTDKTYTLEIIGSAQKMTLTFRMPPLILPHAVSASIYDDDADGVGDRIVVQYDQDISSSTLKSVAYAWPATGTPVPVTGVDAAKGVSGKELTLKGTFSTTVLTSGAGTFTTVWPARKADSTQTTPISDKIGPIIKTAVLTLGTTEDTLRITLSESVKVNAITAQIDALWGIKRAPDGAVEAISSVSMVWNVDGTVATLIYTNTTPNVPRAGNLVRINDGPGMISDLQGNTAGTASRFRLISGGKRSEIKTVTLHQLDPDQALQTAFELTLQPTNAIVTDVVERTHRMGHLIQVDLGAYAATDDFSHVDPSKVMLAYQVSYFTKTGAFVNGAKGSISCTDPDPDRKTYQGDCLTHRGFLFIGWNYTAANGVKVGTGAYVVRLRYQITVAGVVKEPGGLDEIWGVYRQH